MTDMTVLDYLAQAKASAGKPVTCSQVISAFRPRPPTKAWLRSRRVMVAQQLRRLFLDGLVAREYTPYGFRYDLTDKGRTALEGQT